jgi:hypothetical protein
LTTIAINRKTSGFTLLTIAILAIILGLIWTGNLSLESRVITLRYFLFVLTGLAAFLTPYLLFPDKNTPLIQLGNLDERNLTRYIFTKLGSYCWPVLLLMAVMLIGDVNNPFENLTVKIISIVSSWLFFVSVVMLSVVRYVKSGPASQFWKESKKGRDIRQKVADYLKYPIDPGSIPSLMNTMIILTLGSGTIIFAVYLGGVIHPVAETAVFAGLFIYAVHYLQKFTGSIVRDFYSSNSFFREFFGVNMKGEEAMAAREVHQLWWVPGYLRMHVWQFIVQLDRIVPAGRAVAAGHLIVLFIAYQRPDPQFLTIIWVIFALLHHLFVLLTFRDEIAPPWLLRWVAPSHIWFLSRVWIQIRWLLPLLLGMNVQYFLFGTPGLASQVGVTITYLLSGIFISATGMAKLFKRANYN